MGSSSSQNAADDDHLPRTYSALNRTYSEIGGSELDRFWKQVRLFAELPPVVHSKLTESSEEVMFDERVVLFKQGEIGDAFYVIREGEASIDVNGSVDTLHVGDFCGEGALLGNHTRRATVIAKTKLKCLKITRDKFEELGLNKVIAFPKRDKVKTRHEMMARGNAAQPFEGNRRASLVLHAVAKEDKSYLKVQFDGLKEILIDDKINLTAFFLVPLGLFLKFQGYGAAAVFFSNFAAIIPLANILGQATEALSAHTGQLLGGLLNATFGNAVEMIMCVQAVRAGQIAVVQGNLLGSILSNTLLVLGMAIFASGLVRKSQTFNVQGAASNMRCQLVASISVCLPTMFAATEASSTEEASLLLVSRICSAFLVLVYAMFLYFMLYTHAEFFGDDGDGQEDEDALSPTFATLLLMLCTYVVFLCSECLVDSIEDVSTQCGLSKAFIGVILLPIVGNAAEHSTAVMCAYKGMMDLALGVAVGSSTQIGLFVVPCAVMFGWIFDQPMNLNFSIFDTACLMLAVFLVSNVLSQGETTWLDGGMLMIVYMLIAVQTLFINNEEA